MKYSDFYKWEDLSSKIKIKNMENRPYLSNITQVTAERGNFSLKYKTDNEQIFEMDFLQNKIKKNEIKMPKANNSSCGISKEKKDNLVKNLQTIMPANRMNFWINLNIKE